MKYLKELIIGSSIIVVLPFYYGTYYNKKKTYSYYSYTLAAPLWFGIWNIISLIIADKFNLSKRLRFFTISIISLLSIYFIAHFYYDKTPKQWSFYYFQQFIKYMITWNIIIFYLDKYV